MLLQRRKKKDIMKSEITIYKKENSQSLFIQYSLKTEESEARFVKKVYETPEAETLIVLSEEILLTSGEEETDISVSEENDNPYEIGNLFRR